METARLLKCTVDGCDEPRGDQDPKATNRHCRKHQAEMRTRYNNDRLDQEFGKGYSRGVNDMRLVLANEFTNLGAGMLAGEEAAYLIMQAPGPLPREGKSKAEDESRLQSHRAGTPLLKVAHEEEN